MSLGSRIDAGLRPTAANPDGGARVVRLPVADGPERPETTLSASPARRRRWPAAALSGVVLAVVFAGLFFGRFVQIADPPPAPIPIATTTAAETVDVVWPGGAEGGLTVAAVDRAHWRRFIDSRRTNFLQQRTEILQQARTEMAAALAPVFADMAGRVKDYIGWFYFFPTTYRFAFAAVIEVLSRGGDDPRSILEAGTEAINRTLRERFVELVVAPPQYGPAVQQQATQVLTQAFARYQALAAAENQALVAFMAEAAGPTQGLPPGAEAAPGIPVLLSWRELGLSADVRPGMPVLDAVERAKQDPAIQALGSSTQSEGFMLVSRQVVRRLVHSAVNEIATVALLPLVADSVLAPAQSLFSFAAFGLSMGVGLGAEYGLLQARGLVEGGTLTALSTLVVERLGDQQTAALSDAIASHIDGWFGG